MNQERPISMYQACLQHARADRALRGVVANELVRYKVTMMEWLLLGVVQSGPEKGLSMSEIASHLDVTLPQVTALVTGLVKHRLVKQKTQSQDRRSRHVIATQRGSLLLSDIETKIATAMREWLSGIPRVELETYYQTVKRIADNT